MKGVINLDARIYKVNLKVSANERNELNRIIALEGKSLSDVLRKAIRNTYDIEGFEESYQATSQFKYKRKSIFDFKG